MDLRSFNIYTVTLRLLLALVTGGLIGYGRSLKNRNAGLRTYMLTSLGACLAILINLYQYEMLKTTWAPIVDIVGLKYDASRFSASVIGGIGFLAAGTIIGIKHQQVSGLTTATGLFANVCLSIACGAGFYELVLISWILIFISLEVMSPLESRIKRRIRNITLYVEFRRLDDIEEIVSFMKEHHVKIYDIEIENTEHSGFIYPSAIFTLKLSRNHVSHSEMLSNVAEMKCVYSVQELIS